MSYGGKFTGTLYITNSRLLFEHKTGVIRRRYALAAEIPLKSITSVSVEKGPWDWTALILVADGQKHRFLFRAGSPEILIKRISELMTSRS